MKRSDIEFIKDIIESIKTIEDYLNEYSENDFRKDKKIQKLFIYEIMMIGEAASKVSIQTQAKYNTIN